MQPSIFVVEDEADIARLIRHHLEASGFTVRSFTSTHNVISEAEKQAPSLFLLDIMVPGGDGLSLCRRLRENAALGAVPIIFLTAKGDKDALRSGMNLGADDYLTKPVVNADLILAIEARLRRSQQHAQREFKPNFSTAGPLLKLGLTPRAAETLLWLCQGKTNSDIATILGISVRA